MFFDRSAKGKPKRDEVKERERKTIKRPNLLIIIFFLLLGQIGFDKPPVREKRKTCINKPFDDSR